MRDSGESRSDFVAVLGAGLEQRGIILAAQTEGYHVVAFDQDSEAPSAILANRFYAYSARDHSLITLECSRIGVVGVVAAGIEAADTVSMVSYKLGLPCIPPLVTNAMSSKWVYKDLLRQAGIGITRSFRVTPSNLSSLYRYLGSSVVLKPSVGRGSRGVRLIKREEGLVDAFNLAMGEHPEVLMEAYQPGPQLSTETLIWDGRVETVAIADRFYSMTVTAPEFKEYGGSMPSVHEERRDEISSIMRECASVLGITRGTLKGDLVVTDDGIKIIEIHPRLSGGPLHSLTEFHSGVSYFREAVRIACGLEPIWERIKPTKHERLAVGMGGQHIPWDDSRCWIKPNPGKAWKCS